MGKRRNRYQEMERCMTWALIADGVLFLLYLIFAGLGILWLKVILAIFIIAISLIALAFLYLTKELLRQRSLWMSVAAAGILICMLFSLILNFPSPNKYKQHSASLITTAQYF